ncbi:MAG: RNA polymerase Rpb4 family protein [Halobacteriales archaeon]
MTIFKEKVSEEYLTTAEVKEILSGVERERALDESRELPYELARTIEHANRFAVLEPTEAEDLVEALLEIEKVNESTAYKIANLKPGDRDELRAIYAQERYTLSGDELDEILNVLSQYL